MPDDYEPSEDYERDKPLYNLDDVCDRLDNIEAAIKRNHSDVAAWIGATIIFVLLFMWVQDMWYSKARYSWWYDVSSDQILVDKKPADCNFFHAPIGGKGCGYKRQMSSILVKTHDSDTARGPVNYVSYDNGNTWSVDKSEPPTKPQITISWEKVEE